MSEPSYFVGLLPPVSPLALSRELSSELRDQALRREFAPSAKLLPLDDLSVLFALVSVLEMSASTQDIIASSAHPGYILYIQNIF